MKDNLKEQLEWLSKTQISSLLSAGFTYSLKRNYDRYMLALIFLNLAFLSNTHSMIRYHILLIATIQTRKKARKTKAIHWRLHLVQHME